VAKLLCTDYEELYNNFLKPRIKVGNEFVNQDQVSNSAFIVRTFNSVYVLRVRNFLRDGLLNRCACLTIKVYIL
jgi:hypothetical protein